MLSNRDSRQRTNEEIGREALALQEIETQRAKARQLTALKQGNKTPVQENFPERGKGQSRDAVGKRLGISGKTAERAVSVSAWGR